MKVVDTENPLDLSEKSGQEAEVSAGHPYEACYHFRDQLLVRKSDAGRCPSLFQQLLHLSSVERAELMDEPDARIELGKSGNSFLDAWHADEDHAGGALVKDRSHLSKAVHLEAIGFIHQDQSGRVRHCPFFGLIVLVCLKVGRVDWRAVAVVNTLVCP